VPIYTFRLDDGKEIDQIFASWRDAPQELTVDGQTARRVPARFSSHFPNLRLREAAKDGVVPFERGMERDWANARKAREDREDAARRKVIEQALADHPL
jgi:hypothetical protein